jgi:hypothetical protein
MLCLTLQPHAARLAWTSVRTLCNHSPTHPLTHSPSNPHPCCAAGLVLPYLCRVLTHSLTHRRTPKHADAVGLVLPHLSLALTPRLMHTTTVNIATPFVAACAVRCNTNYAHVARPLSSVCCVLRALVTLHGCHSAREITVSRLLSTPARMSRTGALHSAAVFTLHHAACAVPTHAMQSNALTIAFGPTQCTCAAAPTVQVRKIAASRNKATPSCNRKANKVEEGRGRGRRRRRSRR